MHFHYEEWFKTQLLEIQSELGFSDYLFEVSEEQAFAKRKTFDPKTIYVVIKYLSNSLEFGMISQPIQILILTEQNGLDVTKAIFEKFAQDWNYKSTTYSSGQISEYIKHQYNSPVVLSNFNESSYGFRTILYTTGSLLIINNYVDVTNLQIDSVSVDYLNFSLSYAMTPDTQNFGDAFCVSKKNNASISLAITVPSVGSTFMSKVLGIMNGSNTGSLSGNTDFAISWSLGGVSFSFNFKMINAQVVTSPDGLPAIQLGFTL